MVNCHRCVSVSQSLAGAGGWGFRSRRTSSPFVKLRLVKQRPQSKEKGEAKNLDLVLFSPVLWRGLVRGYNGSGSGSGTKKQCDLSYLSLRFHLANG